MIEDPFDPGTFTGSDFIEDVSDPGTFLIAATVVIPEQQVGVSSTTDRLWGWVTGWDLPLTAGDGAMRIDVGVA